MGRFSFLSLVFLLLAPSLGANPLLEALGRNESRIYSAAFPLTVGTVVADQGLEARLKRLGYERVKARPEKPGQYFWGFDVFWIYRRACRTAGDRHRPLLIGLDLDRESGRIVGARDAEGLPLDRKDLFIEPEILAESLDGDRAVRTSIRLGDLPEHVWRPLLAAEDSRFFDHVGVDSRSLARALLANVKAGKVRQGGSTLTQQLIKNRDLTPKRSMGRKASEAVRALALEATYRKEDILEAYLDSVYLGHVRGLAIHGYGTAARVYFGKDAAELNLAESAMLAAIVQAPNRLTAGRNHQDAEERRRWVLDRMKLLGWSTEDEVARAKALGARFRRKAPERPTGLPVVGLLRATAEAEAPKRLEKGRGVVAWSTLDPLLQAWAEEEAAEHLDQLRKKHPRLREAPLSLALVALDVTDGGVLASVGGDPKNLGSLDRVQRARRQPGSAVKPLLLLEAFGRCGGKAPLYPGRRVADEPLTLDLPSGPWKPANSDGEFRGVVDIRRALRESLNVPFVRIGRHCGWKAMGRTLRQAGLDVPPDPPPSLVLGSLEVSPVQLAEAYTALADGGVAHRARPLRRLERPDGRKITRVKRREQRIAGEATAFLVHDLLLEAARDGTSEGASIPHLAVAAKTGTSSDRRDAWLAGYAGGVVTVVWVGLDDGKPLGLTGAGAAAPLWRSFMAKAAPARPPRTVERPEGIVTRYLDPRTGLLVTRFNDRARPELFRRDAQPDRNRFWRDDESVPVLE